MRTLVKQEDAGLLALITSVRTGVAPEVVVEAEAGTKVLAENADVDPADPNDHDMNAASHIGHSKLYHGIAGLLRQHGAPGELHATVLTALEKLGQHHANEANKAQAHSVYGNAEHHDIADSHVAAAHADFAHHLGLKRQAAPFDHTRD